MVAAPRIRKGNNIIEAPIKGESFPNLLKAAVIYGPNASGKSNLLKALRVISLVASRSAENNAPTLPVRPFAFDTQLLDKPSEFEVHFIAGGVRYEFILHLTSDRIIKEELVHYPDGQSTPIYSREYVDDKDHYSFGDMREDINIINTWTRLTPPKTLFISQAVANSNEENNQLRTPFNWLNSGVATLLNGMSSSLSNTQALLANPKDVNYSDYLSEFLREVDIPISKVEVKTIRVPTLRNITPDGIPRDNFIERRLMLLTHQTALGEYNLSLDDQSDGTKNLVGFWLPWFIKDSIGRVQKVLAIDELDNSLHPLIVESLVKKHLAESKTTQLIFTTHDTHLMDAKILRRDQIWLTERDANGATLLRSVHDFEGRESEDIEKRYFAGKYRSLPIIKS